MSLLTDLAAQLDDGRIRVVDLTHPLVRRLRSSVCRRNSDPRPA